ncbi:MAG TPA: Maf family protein [Stellaceae bacterium]|jgi:septum formation protein
MALTSSELILASASTARAGLLAAAGVAFRVAPAAIDEAALKRAFRADRRAASECSLALAEAKARWVSQREPRALVVGADQILVSAGEWFDKPADLGAARAQLQALRGRTHVLATAACVALAGERVWHIEVGPRLSMRCFSDAFLDDYLAAEGAALLGAVGAYRLEARGVQLFDRVEGDHFAILGLPLIELLGFLREFGAISA